MAQRPIWRGHLRLALVSCPVALYSARHDRSAIRFNMINPKTGNRVRMVTQDAETGDELSRRDTVKGYEFKKDTYLIISDEDLASVKVESSSTMAVEKFVQAESIDPIYYDASYYLAPDGKGADDVYAVLREAIATSGTVALARVVISGRERTLALRPGDGGLVCHTLNEERDLNSSKPLFEDVRGVRVDPEMVKLATMLIDRQTGRYDPSDIEDRYETRLRAMIDAKLQGEGVRRDDDEEDRPETNVIDIMAALRKSLADSPKAASAVEKLPAKKGKATAEDRRQTGLKLPITGGKKASEKAAAEPAKEPSRTRRRA